jgi:hypothetical protein
MILLLLLVISQLRIIDSLLDTSLGRTLLLVVLLSVSYVNKILGIVGAFLFIVIFTVQKSSLLESFTSDRTDLSGNMVDVSGNMMDASGNINIPKICKNLSNKKVEQEGFQSIEGFDIIGTESTLLKGKSSNSIHASKENTGNVQPSYSNMNLDYAPI